MDPPVEMHEVREIAEAAAGAVARFSSEIADELDGAEIHHIGATAMSSGVTKGDVDVNVRVDASGFARVVEVLRERFDVAQAQNWTPTFASFSTDRYPVPFGIQVTVIGSDADFLLELCERLRSDRDLLRRYDEVKVGAAPRGRVAYWEAKNSFLRNVLHKNTESEPGS